jgi:transcriptional repressor NrdR
LDEVGYVRFASVYRSFQDVDAFRTEIDQLRRHRRRREPSKDQLPLLPGDATELPGDAADEEEK